MCPRDEWEKKFSFYASNFQRWQPETPPKLVTLDWEVISKASAALHSSFGQLWKCLIMIKKKTIYSVQVTGTLPSKGQLHTLRQPLAFQEHIHLCQFSSRPQNPEGKLSISSSSLGRSVHSLIRGKPERTSNRSLVHSNTKPSWITGM